MKEAITRAAHEAIVNRVFPGCAIGVLSGGPLLQLQTIAAGGHTYDSDSPRVTTQSIYDCASLTKSVVTATLALRAIDEGTLALEDSVAEHLPEFRDPRPRIRHLLTHTLGNTITLSSLANRSPEEIIATVCAEKLREPGAFFSYSNTPSFLLGLVLERICGQLDTVAHKKIFKPLGMAHTTFRPDLGHPMFAIVPSEEGIHGIVHDESARVFSRARRAVGHAGVFSTVTDLLRFCEQLIMNPDPRLSTNEVAHLGASASLGWELDQPWMGMKRTSHTFGKTGFTGAAIACDFDRRTAIVILSNRTYPHRPENREAIDAFRAFVCDIVFGV